MNLKISAVGCKTGIPFRESQTFQVYSAISFFEYT